MNGKDFNEVISLIAKKDRRYDKGAYFFIREALDHTTRSRAKSGGRAASRHVSGQELCEGIRDFALDRYGPMAATLLREWGVRETADFGELVFNLVEFEVFGAREEDSKEDFHGVFDFHESFEKPYLPKGPRLSEACPRNPAHD